MPFYPQSAIRQRARPNSFSFCYFHLWIYGESIKEVGGASMLLCEFFVVSEYDEMNCNLVLKFFTMYS
jgi:hypothetical protein